MGKIKWTDAQKKIIESREQNLLVSAGAGSGKTTVMIERIISLILDKEKPTPVSKFLIISFTKASAMDMKNKLIKKLSELEPTPYVLEQLDDVLTSDVSNLHSFCARLLKSYFYEVGLDPTFVVLDEDEASALKQKALTKLFEQKTQEADANFYELIDVFAKKRKDVGLKEIILKIHDFMCSVDRKDDWFERTINTLYETDLEANSGAKIILSHMIAERRRLLEEISSVKNECVKVGEESLISYVDALESKVLNIREDQNFVENAKRIQTFERLPNIPSVPEKLEWLKEKVKIVKDSVNDRMKKLQEYAVVKDIDLYEDTLRLTQKYVFELYKLEKEFVKIYAELKKERGGLDFNDLEENTLKVLENPIILEELKSKYDYIMVDEYQDINSVQEKILSLLSKDDNRFMVGDVKQSIYRFRLCDPQIFLDKYKNYNQENGAGKLIKLNENFRSKENILQFINEVFKPNMTNDFGGVDYASEAMLVAGDESQKDEKIRTKILIADTGKEPKEEQQELKVYSVKDDMQSVVMEKNARAEGLMIADEIYDVMANETIKDGDRERRIKFSDITILVQSRTSAYFDKLVETLRMREIPVATDVEGNCVDDEFVFAVLSFLEVVACEKVDFSLFNLLKSKLFDFSANELAEICHDSDSKKFFYQNLSEALERGTLSKHTHEKLEDFFNTLAFYREKAKFLSAKEIVKQILKEKNMIEKMSFEMEGEKSKQKLSKFISSLGNKTVFELLSDNSMSEIKSDSVWSSDSVKVMTIHKSKGLEFKVLFLAMASREFNLESMKSNVLISKDLGIGMDFYDRELRYKTSTIAKQAVRLCETRKTLEEQQRLLYVALTRATDFLFIVASTSFEKIPEKMPANPMCFVDFMGHLIKNSSNYPDLKYVIKLYDVKSLLESADEKQYQQVIFEKQEISEETRAILNHKYEFENDINVPMKVAVTSLLKDNVDEQSKVSFFDEELSKSSAKEGTLYHLVLSHLDFSKKTEDEIKSQLFAMEEKGIISNEEMETIVVEKIANFFSNPEFQNIVSNADHVFREKEFFALNKTQTSSSVMQGIVDLLILRDNEMIVLDYKTGNLNPQKLEKYKLQVSIYADAMERSFGLPVKKKGIININTGKIIFV